MKLILDIKDDKADHLLEVLKDLAYVKTTLISAEKSKFMEEMKEAVINLNKVKKGKLKAKPIKQLIDEL